jgi:transcriptional regulator with XRE-family HTH domain
MADTQDIAAELSVFGPRLHELRSLRQWTLDELSERSGLSKTFLSRLEAGGRQPSIAALLTLAKVFGVSIGALLEPSARPPQACVVVRRAEQTSQSGGGLTYAALSSRERFANLQPIRLTVAADREGDEQFQHDGEEWLYLLTAPPDRAGRPPRRTDPGSLSAL